MRWVGLIVLLICSSWLHPVHVSVTNLDLDPVREKVELSVKIFADDFQDFILHKYGVQLNIVEEEEPGDRITAVNQYMQEALRLVFNGNETAHLEYVASKINEGAILMIVTYHDKQNRYRLDNKNTELSFNIKN